MNIARRMMTAMVNEALESLADGLWHNQCPESIPGDWTLKGYFRRWFGLGVAANYGWVEIEDETWVRLTEGGKLYRQEHLHGGAGS